MSLYLFSEVNKRLPNYLTVFVLVLSVILPVLVARPVSADNDLSATITSAPSSVTQDTTANFTFTVPYDEGPVTFECSLDGGPSSACVSPFETNTLADGSHSFSVIARDAFDNVGPPDSHTWTINTIGLGDGSQEDPFLVTDCLDLMSLGGDLDASYSLGSNVDCDGQTITPIGSSGSPFTGTFNGGGFTISNVTYTSATDNAGIFGTTEEATITNVFLDNIAVSGQNRVGALAGSTNYTTISYIGMRNSDVTASGQYAGGLVGYLGGSSIEKSFAEATVVTGTTFVGGLAGVAIGPSTISQSYFQGEVDGSAPVGGITGQVGAGPAYVTETYADVDFTNAGSDVVGATGLGAAAIRNFIASAPYLENNTESPLELWDFQETWYIRSNNYPGLLPLELPQLLCEEPTSTNMTASVSCGANPSLEGPTTWEVVYGYSDDTTWTTLDYETGYDFSKTVVNLLPGTSYRIRFRYINDMGTSPWGSQEVITTGSDDIDNDGITNKEEFKAPNGGDADNDGISDYTQANVTSFLGINSDKYVVLKTSCNDNFNVQIGRESSESKDVAFDYATGLVGFVARGCGLGLTADFSLYFYGQDSTGLVLRKWNDSIYTTVPGAVIGQVTIGGQTVARANYQVTDGSSLDDDGTVDGNIVDPVGLGVSTIGVPVTGFAANDGTTN